MARRSSPNAFGLPPFRPLALAASRPAIVRSRMMLRSNSAKAPKMWKISRPPAVVVSIASVRDRNPHSRLCSSSTVSINWANDLTSRSSFQTTSVSPGLRKSSAAFSCGRSRDAPDAVSSKIRRQPTTDRASVCRLEFCSPVETQDGLGWLSGD
jgi:hypothetical protein